MSAVSERLRRSRRGVVAMLVLVGLGACATAGGVAALVSAVAALGVAGGRVRARRTDPDSLRRWRAANLLALVVCALVAFFVPTARLVSGLALVGWLQIHRAWTGRTPSDARVTLLLSLLLVLLACILTVSAWLAPLFLVAALLTPVALVLIHLEDAADSRGVAPGGARGSLGAMWSLAPASLVLTGMFFAGIPRMDGAGVGGRDGGVDMAGFGQDVELGDLGAILDNPDVVMRVRVRGARGQALQGPFYFRGIALDHFDGRRWTHTLGGEVRAGRTPRPEGELVSQSVVLEPLGETVLFGLPQPVHVEGLSGVTVDTSGTWRWRGDPERLEYTVLSSVVGGASGPAASGRAERAALRSGAWTSLPPGLDPRIGALAATLASEAGEDASPLEVAHAVEEHLRARFTYTDVPEVADARQPLSDFLFRTQRGHCEFFATALAVLLRSQGIPARVVNGFQGGEYNDFGDFVLVRQSDAHSWVEAWFPEQGWVQLDATPASDAPPAPLAIVKAAQWGVDAWHRVVLDYDLDAQLDGVAAFARAVPRLRVPSPEGGSQPLPGGRGLVLLAVGGVLLWGGRQAIRWLAGAERDRTTARRRGGIERMHRRARRLVERRGWRVPAGLPPVAAAEWLVTQAGAAGEPLETLAWSLYRVRYGSEPEAAHLAGARAALRALRRLPRRPREPGATVTPPPRAG